MYSMSGLKSKAFIIPVRQRINTSMFLYLLSGRSKNRADFWGGQAKSTPCPHWAVLTRGQSQDQVLWSIDSTNTARDEPGLGAIRVLLAAKADGTTDSSETGYSGSDHSLYFGRAGYMCPGMAGVGTAVKWGWDAERGNLGESSRDTKTLCALRAQTFVCKKRQCTTTSLMVVLVKCTFRAKWHLAFLAQHVSQVS